MDVDPQPITNWLVLVLTIAAIVSLIAGIVIRVNKSFEHRVSMLIKETTKPIQQDTNGGFSLTDLHNKIDRIERRYSDVLDQQDTQRQAWHARYLADQARIRREWTAVFLGIRKMIHMPQEEQLKMWDEITDSYIDGTIADKYPTERKDKGNDVY